MAPLSGKSAHFVSIWKAQFISLLISENTAEELRFFKASWSIASAETCFLTFRERDLPLTGLKTPHDRQSIPICYGDKFVHLRFPGLGIKVVCLSFDFWDTNFLKEDTWLAEEDKLIPHFGQNLWFARLHPPRLWQKMAATTTRPRFRPVSASGLVTSTLKFCCVLVCVCVSGNFIVFWKRLLCVMKFPGVLEKIVVFPNRL